MGHRVLPGMSGACPRAPFEARHCSPSRRERCQGNGRAWFVWHCRGWTLTVGLYLAQMSHWPADDQDGHRVLGPKVTGGSREGEERETWRKGKEMEKRDTQGERQDRRRVHVTQTHRHIRTHQARARSRAVPKASLSSLASHLLSPSTSLLHSCAFFFSSYLASVDSESDSGVHSFKDAP